jgi:hypothetical protein
MSRDSCQNVPFYRDDRGQLGLFPTNRSLVTADSHILTCGYNDGHKQITPFFFTILSINWLGPITR